MSYRNLVSSGCGCGCGTQSCGCNSCCQPVMMQAPVYPPSYLPAAPATPTNPVVDPGPCQPKCWQEELRIDFDPLWQGNITNGTIASGVVRSSSAGPVIFESKPISMGERNTYLVELEAPTGVALRYRYSNTLEGLAIQQYINANGADKNFMYIQVLATVEAMG